MLGCPRVADHDSYIVIRHLTGKAEHVQGPAQVFFNRFKHQSVHVEKHRRYVATERQYVDIVYLSGRFERRLGPCQFTFDPFEHSTASVETLKRHIASQSQYLIVQYKDGRVEHIRGPADLCFHPLEHEMIRTEECIKLAANEAIVVYRRTSIAIPVGKLVGENPTPALVANDATRAAGAGTDAPTPMLTAEVAGQEGFKACRTPRCPRPRRFCCKLERVAAHLLVARQREGWEGVEDGVRW